MGLASYGVTALAIWPQRAALPSRIRRRPLPHVLNGPYRRARLNSRAGGSQGSSRCRLAASTCSCQAAAPLKVHVVNVSDLP
jgi:hypothetical protein